jgi:hypothetical protein
MSGWIELDIVRGLGNPCPVTEVTRGADIPSSYTGGKSRANVVSDCPKVGFFKLLQCPVKLLNGVVASQGCEKSSHCGYMLIGEIDPVMKELTSINCKLFEKSSKVCRFRR